MFRKCAFSCFSIYVSFSILHDQKSRISPQLLLSVCFYNPKSLSQFGSQWLLKRSAYTLFVSCILRFYLGYYGSDFDETWWKCLKLDSINWFKNIKMGLMMTSRFRFWFLQTDWILWQKGITIMLCPDCDRSDRDFVPITTSLLVLF